MWSKNRPALQLNWRVCVALQIWASREVWSSWTSSRTTIRWSICQLRRDDKAKTSDVGTTNHSMESRFRLRCETKGSWWARVTALNCAKFRLFCSWGSRWRYETSEVENNPVDLSPRLFRLHHRHPWMLYKTYRTLRTSFSRAQPYCTAINHNIGNLSLRGFSQGLWSTVWRNLRKPRKNSGCP